MGKKLLTIICMLFVGLQAFSQSVITIGTGTNTASGVNYNPIYRSSAASSFDYSRAFYLFTAAELAAAGLPAGATITQIEWDKSNNGATVSTTANVVFNIFMNNTSLASYATSSSWGTLNTGATLVYNNNNQVIPATTGFLPFVLTTPYVYNGNSLEISTDWDISAVSGNPATAAFSFSYTPVANSVGGTSSGTPLSAASIMGTQSNRPNIRITFTPPPACSGAPNSGIATITSSLGCPNTAFNLSATGLSAASALTYQWYSAPSASGPWSSISSATNIAFTTSVTSTSYFQMVTTCTVSSLSATTSVVSYSVVNPGPCICNNYGASSATNVSDEDIWNVTFGTLNNTSNCTVVAPGSGSALNLYGNYTGFVSAPTVLQGQSVPFSVDINTCGGWFGMEFDIYIDYNQNGLFTDPGELAYTNTSALQGANTGNINIPLTATPGITRMRVVAVEGTVPGPTGTYFYGETEDYCIDIQVPSLCSGAPNSGTASINTSTGCPNVNLSMSATGITNASGIIYQWQSAPSASGPWTNIPTANNTTYTTTVAATTFFQMVTTCTVSSLSATTSIVSYSVVNPGPCICNGYGASAATSVSDEEIWNVTFGSLNNTSNCTVAAPGPGSALNMYGNYAGFVSAPTVLQGQSVPFSVDINTCGGWYGVAFDIYIDYNQNGLFTDAGELAYTNSAAIQGVNTGNISIPLTATPGTTRMRVVAVEGTVPGPTGTYTWGETEDYCIDIQVPAICSGAPNSGTAAINTSTGCPNVNLSMNATGVTNASGIIYQWQSAPSASGPWTNIPTANNTTYTTTVTATTYFQMVTTCTASALSATTSIVSYSVINPGPCICAGYGPSAATSIADEEILNVTFGSLNSTSSCTTIAPGAGSSQNLYSNYSGFTAAPVVLQGQSVPFSLQIGTCGGNFNNCAAVYIDYNQNGLFTDPGEQAYLSAAATNGPHFETGNITIPLTASAGITRMRVVNVETGTPASINPTGTYSWGETEDYCIDIQVPLLCSGAPNSGTASINTPTGCPNVNLSMSATGVTNASGIIYQWQSAPSASGPWTNIPTANNTTYTTTVTATTYFQMVTTCTASALSATTSIVSYSVINPGPCICGGYANSAATSTADEEILNVTFSSLNNTSNCTTTGPGPGSILNRYSNYSGFVAAPVVLQGQSVPFNIQIGTCGGNFNNSTAVYIDYNQNGVFTDPGEQAYLSAAATNGPHFETGNISIPVTASVGVTRMRVINVETATPSSISSTAAYTWGETEDYCIDIQTPLPCAGAPASGTAAISTPTGCISDAFNLTATGVTNALGITYQWQSAPSASGPWTNIVPATSTSYSTTSASIIFFQMVTTCTTSALSATTSIVSYTPFNCYVMSNATITACGGTVYDSGGPLNNYQSNEDYTLTILPSSANSSVQVSFSSFAVETCCDYLEIYDGTNTSAPLIGQYTALPPNITASNAAGALTFRFFSDISINQTGFAAAITCTTSCSGPPAAPSATDVSICSGNAATLTAASSSATTQWYTTATATNYIAQGTVFVTPILNSSVTYFVKDSTACGISSATAVNVTVTPTPTLNVSSSSNSVCIGSSATLTASGSDTFTWSTTSTNTSIVVSPTVSTTYTVTGYSAACDLTQTISITLGTNPNPTVTLSTGGVSTICVTNGSIALVGSPNGGVYSGVGVTGNLQSIANAGTFTPVYSYTDAATGCTAAATTTIVVANCTGINSFAENTNELRVYPNPNTGSFNIETNATGLKTIEITDLSGRLIISEKTDATSILMNINHLDNGMYQVKVKTENGVDVIKIIKQ